MHSRNLPGARGETDGRHGPHGGPQLAVADGFVEISVFETNVPPCFRLYFFDEQRAPIAPRPDVEIATLRPGGERQVFNFRPQETFVESTTDIPEPHEFHVMLTVGTDQERKTYETQFTEEAHGHAHGSRVDSSRGHGHEHGTGGHGHKHGIVDPMITTTARGLWAVKWSFVGLLITASLQLVVVILSHSVALLADMIHNFGDAATAVPLAIAFLFARRPPTRSFTFGFGRVEDLAGLAVILTIITSAIVAGYAAVDRLIHPHAVDHLGAIIGASIIGFLGNEGVAIFRIRVGKQIGSAALIADGYHARTDGWTSLAVLVGALGVHFGYQAADPIIGLVITVAILGVVWQSVKAIFTRMLDGVEPEVIDEVRSIALGVPGIVSVAEVRARWIGHRLRAEVNVAVASDLTVSAAHAIVTTVQHELQHHLKFLSGVVIHVDPAADAGEAQHQRGPHVHDGLPSHAH